VRDADVSDILRSSAWESESAEWEAVGFEIDESEFAPEILPEEVSEAFDVITEPTTVRRIRVATDLSWAFEEED
jgi:hypothetical protein